MIRMFRPGMWVGLLLGIAFPVMAQESTAPPRIELRENTPNPFFPSTTITFEIHKEVCNRGHQPVVTLRVYNVLVQVVAAPTIKDSTGQRLENVRLRCGSYVAYWDGRGRDGHEVHDGVYYYQLVVDGERVSTRKMIVRRGEP